MVFSLTSPLLSLAFASWVAATPTVQLNGTTLIGRELSASNLEFFGGIPYAEPPLGDLRLACPVRKGSLNVTTFDASNFGPVCYQRDLPVDQMSEDCLTINVLRPANTSQGAALPVMAWIHGGGFDQGGSNLYNGSAIVAQSVRRGTPIIYVNFNYRLGPLGFPQGHEAAEKRVLNLGLRDMILALGWIQDNIATFGGAKSKVTVFGESAGAISIGTLFFNSLISQYARAAIFESGSAATTISVDTLSRDSDWDNFVSAIPGCSPAAGTYETFRCIRAANTSDLLPAVVSPLALSKEVFPWDNTIDGPGGLLPDFPSKLWAEGNFAHIPFISGNNLDEGTLLTHPWTNSTEQIRSNLIANYTPALMGERSLDGAVDGLLELYPDIPALGAPHRTGNETFGLSPQYKRASVILGDLIFDSQRRNWTNLASQAGIPTYGYLFTDPPTTTLLYQGVSHLTELPYVFGTLNGTASAKRLSSVMIDYWISFASELTPNDGKGIDRPTWPQYTPDKQVLLELNGAEIKPIPDNFRKEQIDFIINKFPVFHTR
ncbi:hypothetical protein ONZ45_g18166 [Pleurotus djamor]|nr:hypothetical protein ONZ45_g18166 [Pleurotus djamor]